METLEGGRSEPVASCVLRFRASWLHTTVHRSLLYQRHLMPDLVEAQSMGSPRRAIGLDEGSCILVQLR